MTINEKQALQALNLQICTSHRTDIIIGAHHRWNWTVSPFTADMFLAASGTGLPKCKTDYVPKVHIMRELETPSPKVEGCFKNGRVLLITVTNLGITVWS